MAISGSNAKRMKLESEEVCIILEGASIYSFLLYIVDLNEKPGPSMKLLEPFFRCSIKFPYSGAYVMLNSDLYRFGGYSGGKWTSESWRFDLKPYFGKVSSCDSSLDSRTEILGMTSKCEPCAVVVGDRICVFSLYLMKNLNNFELYNPKDGKWSPLPELPFTLPTSREEKVNYYAVEKGDLLIQTSLGSYSITIDEQWKPNSNDTNRPLETSDEDGPCGIPLETPDEDGPCWIPSETPRVDGPDFCGCIGTNSPRQWNPCELPEVDVDEGCGLAKKGDLLISPCLDVADIAKPDGEPYSFWKLQNEGCLPSSGGFIPSHQAVVPLLDKHGLRTCTVEVGGNGCDFYGNYDLLLRLTVVRFGERPCEGDNMLLNIRLYELAHDFFNNLAIVKGIYPLRNFISGS